MTAHEGELEQIRHHSEFPVPPVMWHQLLGPAQRSHVSTCWGIHRSRTSAPVKASQPVKVYLIPVSHSSDVLLQGILTLASGPFWKSLLMTSVCGSCWCLAADT